MKIENVGLKWQGGGHLEKNKIKIYICTKMERDKEQKQKNLSGIVNAIQHNGSGALEEKQGKS